MKAKFGQLFIVSENNDKKTTHIFLSEPTPLEEKNFGRIFSIIELESLDPANKEIISLINDEIVNNYYRSTELDIDVAFENCVHLLNRKLQQVTAELGEDWVRKLNACVAVIKAGQLQFAQVGSIQIFLSQSSQIIGLHEKNKYDINPLKIFSNISNGMLNDNSSVIFCTESLLDYLSQEKIKKVLQDNDPDEASRSLQEILENNANYANFAALIIKMLPINSLAANINADSVIAEEKMEKNSFNENRDSMQRLVEQEANTKEFLEPSLWPSLKKNLDQWKNKQKSLKSISKENKTIPSAENNNIPTALLVLKRIFIFLKNLGWQIITALIWLFRKIAGMFQNHKEYSSKFSSLPRNAGGKINKIINWFIKLSSPRKAFFILFIVIALFFIQSVIWQGESKQEKEDNAKASQNLTDATNKLGEAETKLVMSDASGAKKLANEANALIKEIPEKNNLDQSKLSEQKSKLQELLDRVNNIKRIGEPESVANFAILSPAPNINDFVHISKYFYGFDEKNASIYRYDTDSKTAEIDVEDNSDKFSAITKDSAGSVLTVLENGKFKEFSQVLKKLMDLSVGFENDDHKIADLKVYGSKLYTLDVKNSQIYKHAKSGDNYGIGQSWLDEEIDLSDAKNFSIDGSIYLLKDKGEVLNFFSGLQKKDWRLETVDPSIENAKKIFTDENTKRLYILDPQNKRVVAFNKENGTMEKQYISDKWTDLKDFSIEEDENAAYVLSGTEVFKINLE